MTDAPPSAAAPSSAAPGASSAAPGACSAASGASSAAPPVRRGYADKSRIVSFSDNVISIALTLLVLDVRVPANLSRLSFHTAVVVLGPRLLSFTLSFAIVGVYWVAHHLMFAGFQQVGRKMLWLNNLFLLAISLIPASAALLGGFPGERVAGVLNGLNLMLVTTSMLVILVSVVRFHRQEGLPLNPEAIRVGYHRLWSGFLIGAIGIGLAWVNPWLSYAVYAMTPAAYIVLQFL